MCAYFTVCLSEADPFECAMYLHDKLQTKERCIILSLVKLPLCLTKHHAMTYWRSGGI